jgi:predicted MPP superfamily phosphohydrolase
VKHDPDQVPPIPIAPWRIRFAEFFTFFQGVVFDHPPGRFVRRLLTVPPAFTEVPVTLRRGGAGLDGMTIAFLSDLHAGHLMDERDLVEQFERVAERRPDLVVLGGDLIDHAPEEALLYRRALARLAPPLGVFAVPGNHEYHTEDGLDLWRETLEAGGVTVLLNRGEAVTRNGARLWIGGIDNLGRGTADLPAALAGRRDGEPTLLVSHEPDAFDEAARADVDLTLSGHTHGGQIALFGWSPIRHTEFGWWRGRYERDGSVLYVGRGVGYSMLPIRVGSPAEVPVVTLRVKPPAPRPPRSAPRPRPPRSR